MSIHPDLKNTDDPRDPKTRAALRAQLYATLEDRCREACAGMDAMSAIVKILGDDKLSEIMSEMAKQQRDWGYKVRQLAIELEVERQKNK